MFRAGIRNQQSGRDTHVLHVRIRHFRIQGQRLSPGGRLEREPFQIPGAGGQRRRAGNVQVKGTEVPRVTERPRPKGGSGAGELPPSPISPPPQGGSEGLLPSSLGRRHEMLDEMTVVKGLTRVGAEQGADRSPS